MKEAIGGSWLFLIVIVFLSLFACFISVSVNLSKSYKVKDEILFLIEKNHGMNKAALEEMSDYLTDVGYRSTGKCPTGDGACWYGFSYDNTKSSSMNPNFCVKKTVVSATAIGHPNTAYYSVKVFFKLDMPVLNNVLKFTVDGETSQIVNVNDTLIKNVKC